MSFLNLQRSSISSHTIETPKTKQSGVIEVKGFTGVTAGIWQITVIMRKYKFAARLN